MLELTKPVILPRLKKPEKYDLISLIMIYLGEPNKQNTDILEILDTLFDFNISAKEKLAKLHDNYDIKLTGSIEKEANTMGNLAQGVFDYGMKQGLEQGLTRAIKNLTVSTGWPIEKAMEMLDIPAEEHRKFIDMIMNKKPDGTD